MTFDVQESIRLQKEFCEKKGYPHFAPENGYCWYCGRNIYQPIEGKFRNPLTGEISVCVSGIPTEQAGSQLVTGCPHCHRSYCD